MSDAKFLSGKEPAQNLAPRPGRSSATSDDPLLTARLPAISPPPMRPVSSPPAPPEIPRLPSFDPGAFDPGAVSIGRGPEPSGPPEPRKTWWRAALGATLSSGFLLDDRALRRRLGAASVALAFLFVLLALVVGLRHAPPGEPAVVAAVVVSRALIAASLVAFALALLRAAERLFGGATLPALAPTASPQDVGDTVRPSGAPGFN